MVYKEKYKFSARMNFADFAGCHVEDEVEIEFDGTETEEEKNKMIEDELVEWEMNHVDLGCELIESEG